MRVPISQFYKGSEVDENSVVDISSVKFVDKSSVLVKSTDLKLEDSSIPKCVFPFSSSIIILLPSISFDQCGIKKKG